MKVLGIDLGSRFVKLVVYEGQNQVFSEVYDTVGFYREYCRNEAGSLSLRLDRLLPLKVDRIVSTGYGRNNIRVLGAEVITELKAHALGAALQTGLENFTLLDVGGQDSKVMRVEKGRLVDMLLNDKCAASSGRYLENMAALLGVPLDELTVHYKNPLDLNSTCAVFAESELIGHISEGVEASRLYAGVNHSLYKRIKPMLARFTGERIVFVGGVAYNKAMQQYIREEETFRELIVPEHPILNGAIGCCRHALS